LTPGQMRGGALKDTEDKMMSAPITGHAILSSRQRSIETFNRAAWNRVLEPLGQKMPDTVKMGREATDYVDDRVSDAYQRIVPNLRLTSVQNDPAWVHDMTTAINDARGSLPDAEFNHFEKLVRSQLMEKLGPTGTSVDGDVINGIDSQLGFEVRGYKRSQEHDKQKLGAALEDVQASFRSLLERQNPQYANDLRAARAAYANYVRVGKAASAQGTAANDGIFSPAQLNVAVRSENNTTRKLGYGKGKALLQDLSDAAVDVVPSKYPDSGTAGRNALMGMLGLGAGGASWWMHDPTAMLLSAGGLGALAIPATKPVSRAINMAVNRLSQQPGPGRNALADILRSGGQVAAPAVGSYAAGVTPPSHP